jgi:peptidoglycan/LPS O-acetylase OafA/YrhL
MFHTFGVYSKGDHSKQILNHGYLAVDFFFLLSGFVVVYAYDDRWEKMSQWNLYKRRLIRLQPMVIADAGALYECCTRSRVASRFGRCSCLAC